MTTPAEDLLQLLRDAGFVDTAIGWGHQPDSPIRYITLRDTGGPSPLFTLESCQTDRPTIQVLIRAKLGSEVAADAQSAYSALRGYNFTLAGNTYQAVQPEQFPTDLGKDQNGNREFVFTLQIHRGG